MTKTGLERAAEIEPILTDGLKAYDFRIRSSLHKTKLAWSTYVYNITLDLSILCILDTSLDTNLITFRSRDRVIHSW